MIEILTIAFTILSSIVVEGPTETVNLVSFEGKVNSPYFVGKILPGGMDRVTYIKSEDEKTLSGSFSARYTLEGKDYEGQECKIFVENNVKIGENYTHPHIITDCKALDALNGHNLKGKVDTENGNATSATIRIYKPLTQVPDSARKPATKQGKNEKFNYTVNINGKIIKKRAQVYVPYGYDKDDKTKKYNVLYLMHGGGDNTTSFLTPPHNWFRLLDVLDHLIEDGKMDPILVVCPTVYEDDFNLENVTMMDGLEATRNFHLELRKYLIPTVEKKYNTYYTGNEKDDIENTRDHRAFGGFSMGSICTWFQLAFDLEAVSRFIPLSGDIWLYDDDNNRQPANVAAKWIYDQIAYSPYADDFKVFSYTGTKDIAGNGTKALIKELYKYDLFSAKNMEFGMRDGGEHYYGHINEYLYHALPLLWEKQKSDEETKEEEPKEDSKEDTKEEPKEDTKEEPKEDTKEEPKEDTKEEPKEDTKEETKEDTKEETKEESRVFYSE